jgi:lipoic acid synthetase
VKTHAQGNPVDAEEPDKVGEACVAMGLRYVVLTMVDRDDLPDGGAAHVAATIRAIKRRDPEILVGTLTGDFQGDRGQIGTILDAGPDVFAHNVETVLRLTPRVRDHRCSYVKSLEVLRLAKEIEPEVVTKSSIMLGLGESEREVDQAMDDLREYGVDVVTFGQYLQPTAHHQPIDRYVTPEEFATYRQWGLGRGSLAVVSGVLVRSSDRAEQVLEKNNVGLS